MGSKFQNEYLTDHFQSSGQTVSWQMHVSFVKLNLDRCDNGCRVSGGDGRVGRSGKVDVLLCFLGDCLLGTSTCWGFSFSMNLGLGLIMNTDSFSICNALNTRDKILDLYR